MAPSNSHLKRFTLIANIIVVILPFLVKKKWGSKARSEIYGDRWSVFVVCNLRFPSKFGQIRGWHGPQTVAVPRQPLNCIAVCKKKIIRFLFSLPHNWEIVVSISLPLTILDETVVRHVSVFVFPSNSALWGTRTFSANSEARSNPVEIWSLSQSEVRSLQ